MVVSGEMIRKGLVPDPLLFFGFEDLDFHVRVKDAGYEVLVDCSLFMRNRQRAGKIGFKSTGYKMKTKNGLRREYYSLRSLLRIADKNG